MMPVISDSNILWPTSLPQKPQQASFPHGYVIGWEDNRTIIVAGIIPSACLVKGVAQGFTKDQINAALLLLKEKKYPSIDKKCQPWLFVIDALKIVAVWDGTAEISSIEPKQMRDDSTLPTIVLLASGPSILSTTTILTVFDPIQDNRSYYRHDLNPTYVSLKRDFGQIGETSGSFQKMLMRMSEAENLMSDLNQILKYGYEEDPIISKKSGVTMKEKDGDCNISCSFLSVLHSRVNKKRSQDMLLHDICICFPLVSTIIQLYRSTASRKRIGGMSCHFKSRGAKAKLELQHYHQLASSIIDTLLGIILGIFIFHNEDSVIHSVSAIWTTINLRILGDNIGWLETFPVGFKLNVPLTKVMGRVILWCTETHSFILKSAFTTLEPYTVVRMLGILSILFGLRATVAISYDTAMVVVGHIQLIQWAFQRIFSAQLSLFSSLWHLFRGKKKNILRQRSDTLEYDFMQLFLGMIVFTICLFLFTTVLVYHTFFTVVHLAVRCCIGSLWGIYFILTFFPFGDVVMAAIFPGMFCTQVFFTVLDCDTLKMERRTLSPFRIAMEALKIEVMRVYKSSR